MRASPLLAVLAAAGWTAPAGAVTFTVDADDDLFDVLSRVRAGDEVVIVGGGVYETDGAAVLDLAGTEDAPIVIRSEGPRPLLRGREGGGVLSLDASWTTIEGIELTGAGVVIDVTEGRNLTLSGLEIAGLGASAAVRMTASGGRYEDVVIRDTRIFGAGGEAAIDVGCDAGDCVVAGVRVENAHLYDLGPSGGVRVAAGAADVVVVDCVIESGARPAILAAGAAEAPTLVERNFAWLSGGVGLRLGPGTIARNNLVVRPGGTGVELVAGAGVVGVAIQLSNNTVQDAVTCLDVGGAAASGASLVVTNNALYCEGGAAFVAGGADLGEVVLLGNVGVGDSEAPRGYAAGRDAEQDFIDVTAPNLYPSDDSPLLDVGDGASAPSDDFNGDARDDGSPDAGAYERDREDPGGGGGGKTAPADGFKNVFEWSFDPPGWSFGGNGGDAGGSDTGRPDGSTTPGDTGGGTTADLPTGAEPIGAEDEDTNGLFDACDGCGGCQPRCSCDNTCQRRDDDDGEGDGTQSCARTGSCGSCGSCGGKSTCTTCASGRRRLPDPSFPLLMGFWGVYVLRKRRGRVR